jgi:hypothetical protein
MNCDNMAAREEIVDLRGEQFRIYKGMDIQIC